MRLLFSALLMIAFAAPALAVEATNPVEVREWLVPYPASRPRDAYAVSAEEVWFVGQTGHYLSGLNPLTGEFVKRDLPDKPGPHNLIVGSDGIVWYAGNLKGYIGRYDPAEDKIETIAMPDEAARDPHTLIFDKGQENIWFTVQNGNFIGRLNIASRKVDLIPVPTERARPYGIIIAPDGMVWSVLFGTNKLASVDPQTLALTEYDLPDPDARPRRIGVTSKGVLFYVDYLRGYLGRFDPATSKFSEWAAPSGPTAQPYGMAVDGKDRIWYAETGTSPNNIVGFDPAKEEIFTITPVPSGGGTVRHMEYHAETEQIWFGTDTNTVGRAKVGEKEDKK